MPSFRQSFANAKSPLIIRKREIRSVEHHDVNIISTRQHLNTVTLSGSIVIYMCRDQDE